MKLNGNRYTSLCFYVGFSSSIGTIAIAVVQVFGVCILVKYYSVYGSWICRPIYGVKEMIDKKIRRKMKIP